MAIMQRYLSSLARILVATAAVCAALLPAPALAAEEEPVLAAALQQEASAGPCLGEPASRESDVIDLQASSTAVFNIGLIGEYHQTEARKLVDLINQARAAQGVRPLTYDTNLEAVAMLRAAEIQVSFDHTRPNGQSCFNAADELGVSTGSAAGENILMGASSASYANALWTNSPGHYSNMINSRFSSIGVAAFEAGGRWCWVEFFGATSGTGFDESALDGYATVIVQAQAIYLNQVFIDVNPNDWYVASDGGENFLYTLNHGLMSGYSDRPAFGPYDTITRGQVATILYRMAGEPKRDSAAFSDVNYGAYYGDAIKWARATGVINGYGASNTFGPDDPITREQLCVMLASYANKIGGLNTTVTSSSATRMPDWSKVSSWAQDAVKWVINEGIMNGVEVAGGGRELQPQGNAARASAAVMIAVFHRDVL